MAPKPSQNTPPAGMVVDATFALAMNEGMVSHQALDMAVLGLLLPDAK